jgi:hypothetical protein
MVNLCGDLFFSFKKIHSNAHTTPSHFATFLAVDFTRLNAAKRAQKPALHSTTRGRDGAVLCFAPTALDRVQ